MSMALRLTTGVACVSAAVSLLVEVLLVKACVRVIVLVVVDVRVVVVVVSSSSGSSEADDTTAAFTAGVLMIPAASVDVLAELLSLGLEAEVVGATVEDVDSRVVPLVGSSLEEP